MSPVWGPTWGSVGGPQWGPNWGGASMAGVAQDATSGIYCPATAAQWTTTLAAAGLAISGPRDLWLLQEASGTNADTIGPTTLSNTGPMAYQQTQAGWSRKGMTAPNVDAGYYIANTTDTGLPSNTTSWLVLMYVAITGAPASGTRGVFLQGNVDGLEVKVNTGPAPEVITDAGTPAVGSSNLGTTVHPMLVQFNHTASSITYYDDLQYMSPTFTTPDGTKEIFFGGATTAAPGMWIGYAAMFTGTGAELTTAQIKTLLHTLGWSTAY